MTIESELKPLQHELKMLRNARTHHQREIFEIDEKIQKVMIKITDLKNKLPKKNM